MRTLLILAIALLGGNAAQAQVAQWNQIVTDKALEKAFYRALREVSVEYINQADADGRPAVIAFVDSQLDYPLQLTSSNYRHVLIHAAHSKIAYLLQFQAKTTAGVEVPIGGYSGVGGFGGLRVPVGGAGRIGAGRINAEIPGDGGMMLCPINKDGLEFMIGGLAIVSAGDDHQFRTEQDGADIIRLQDRILELTYRYYGHTPAQQNRP